MSLIEEAEKFISVEMSPDDRQDELYSVSVTADNLIARLVDKLKESEKLQETNYELQSFNNTNLKIIKGKDEAIAELVKTLKKAEQDLYCANPIDNGSPREYLEIADKYEVK